MMTMDVTKPDPPSNGGVSGLSGGSVASGNGSQQAGGPGSGGGQNGIGQNGQNGPHSSHNSHNNQQLCAGCGKHIQDRFLLRALDLLWHEDCLKCGCCDCRLGEVGSTLYTKGNLMLCKRDYLRLFGNTGFCAACNKVIPAFEMVMRARNNVYHLECFACQQCNHRFCVGDKFYLCENKILCEYDYEERLVFASMANHPMLKRQIGQPGGPQQQQQQPGGPHPVQNGIGGHGAGQQQQQGQSQNPNSLMSQLVAGQRAAGGDHNNNSNLPVSLGGGGPSPFGTPTHMKAALSSAS